MNVTGDVAIADEPMDGADAQALIAALNAELRGLYDPEDNHFTLTGEQVAPGSGAFLVARVDGTPVGCGAVRRVGAGAGEIKRMYVAPEARGLRLAARLLAALEERAAALGLTRLVLETGPRQHAALRLYERAGYTAIPQFGEYIGGAMSLCFGKDLAPGRG
ncbi:GNAT family N-acetyltransferase [Actinomadura parmotrematis]|uniref:GNAT family N-acetyltransferase n=1 Tax=Actinomadura parmotrematis TaxID=2864039 RepID=A0ABS7FTH9_9ACTN|nr:GNAT family N-acetyltransferase [Actinomadura parmotrematis]MBW8483616.1 GNAT family N-acetyltransferase [Actinomadura parmotrematis]